MSRWFPGVNFKHLMDPLMICKTAEQVHSTADLEGQKESIEMFGGPRDQVGRLR